MRFALFLLALVTLAACQSTTAPEGPLPPCPIIGITTWHHNGKVDTLGIAYQQSIFCQLPPSVDSLLKKKKP